MENIDDPNAASKNIKWHNTRDEVYGLLCLSISKDLLFHLDGLSLPNEVWEKLQTLVGKKNNTMGHQLEKKLISLKQIQILASLLLQV